jgi:signal transduction histidine kinase
MPHHLPPRAGLVALLSGISVAISLTLRPGLLRASVSDVYLLCLVVATTAAFFWTAKKRPKSRLFWLLMGCGMFLWAVNQCFWVYFEVILHRDVPEPFVGDIVLFMHLVPCMAAVALRPHLARRGNSLSMDTINFFMLLLWWVFLYAFVIFPDEFVIYNGPTYSPRFDLLYLIECLVLMLALGLASASATLSWRQIYSNLLVGFAVYTLGSDGINAAINRGVYSSGSLYDLPLVIAAAWLLATALHGAKLPLDAEELPTRTGRWGRLSPRVVMAAILSLPLLGLWTIFLDHEVERLRDFRILVTLVATMVLGLFVFLKQFLLDRELIGLLDDSQRSYENLQRLQTQLVQKEKLASLGQLVAGAAHEINNPLTAILGYSELLATSPGFSAAQSSMAEKIGQQARRTRDLVADLLSFAQQSPSDKASIDVAALLRRALQMQEVSLRGKKIRVETNFAPVLPRIRGNSNQLLQTFLHITENAVDALEEVGGGVLLVSAGAESQQVVVQFADSGPGIKEPQRVFDPFYTTKPVGKGTGLGLSASYGVIQDHGGMISCHNKPEGGAIFTILFPAEQIAASAAQG